MVIAALPGSNIFSANNICKVTPRPGVDLLPAWVSDS